MDEYSPRDNPWTLDDASSRAETSRSEALEKSESGRGKWVALMLGLIIVATVATIVLLMVDFRMLNGDFIAERQVATTAAGIGSGDPLPVQSDVDLYVLGDSSMTGDLGEKLAGVLGTSRYFREVRQRQGPLQPATRSLVVVEVTQQSFLWTPFYSRSDLAIRLAYASDGKVDWANAEGGISLGGDQPVVHVEGSCRVSDSAYGLVSLPGYHSYLDEKIASEISQDIDSALSGAGH